MDLTLREGGKIASTEGMIDQFQSRVIRGFLLPPTVIVRYFSLLTPNFAIYEA